MPSRNRRPLPLSTVNHFHLAKATIAKGLALTTLLLVATWAFCQEKSPTTSQTDATQSQDAASAKAAPEAATATVPAGTRIALVLTHPIQTRYIHRGDDVYAQIVSPITVGNKVIVAEGALVQGKVDRIERRGRRGEVHLQSLSIIFPDGYVAPVSGQTTLVSDDGYALQDPGQGRVIGAFAAPAAGVGLGALIGHATASTQPQTITSTLPPGCTGPPPGCLSSSVSAPASAGKNTVIGAAVGGAIGAVVSLTLLLHAHNFFLDAGAPVEMILQQPLVLANDQVAEAIRDAERHPGPVQEVAARPQRLPAPDADPGICYTPGTPGTPDVDIPGTPAIGDSPGTPPTHIPGIPATPPTAHPCP
jgi:hypothetical protein